MFPRFTDGGHLSAGRVVQRTHNLPVCVELHRQAVRRGEGQQRVGREKLLTANDRLLYYILMIIA